ncbi:MAG: Na/Pi cotransporter family protein [Eubacterium sp.]|nr:Na/Pi cotransporter family protein [Eubacterium sp.]
MDILSILQLFGGVGLFLFGMSLMGSSLELLAGGSLQQILEALTTSKKKGVGEIKGWALGTGVTAIIQSSAATTIMLIGFVNAGIMKIGQAIPVVLGANVGSTATAQILRLGDIGSGNLVLKLLKPSSFAPMLVGVGAFIVLFSKKKRLKNIAGILIGLGVLFYGMTMMEQVFAPLKESPTFQKIFLSFQNPLLGIAAGLFITAVIQSSSASVGILQALSATGAVTFGTAIPIIIGQNLGKCMTILLGAIGANKNARRVSLSYLLFNVFGALFFFIVIYGLHYTIGIAFLSNPVNRGDIANLHLGFNLITSLILLPFSGQLAGLTEKIVGTEPVDEAEKEFMKLDDRLLQTPVIALDQCRNLMDQMIERIEKNYKLATGLISQYDEAAFALLDKNESFVDRCETVLTSYIIRIDRSVLSEDQKFMISEILNSISDLERIGDYCMNIAYEAKEMDEDQVSFSESGSKEMNLMIKAGKETLSCLFTAFRTRDRLMAIKVEPLSETIEQMKDIMKEHHIIRLQEGVCDAKSGATFFDLANCFDRISAHAGNVSLHVIKRMEANRSFDEMHGHAQEISGDDYIRIFEEYEKTYLLPVRNNAA